MKSTIGMKPICLLIIFAGLAGCNRETEQRTVDLTVPVTVEAVELGSIESLITATGTLRPAMEAQIITEIKGDLEFVAANGTGRLSEGTYVKKGQLVVRLDNQEHVVGVRLEPKKLSKVTAQRTLTEQELLFERGLATEKDVENAQRTMADAESGYQDALIQIEKTRLRAPISGYLTGIADITEGTRVNQNTVLASIMDYNKVLVDLKIPNSQISTITMGQKIRVFNYAFPDLVFEGTLTEIDPALDPTTRTFTVVGTVDNPDNLLRPGMFVKSEIVTLSQENVVLVNRELVLIRRNQKVVFVEEEGRAQMREVTTGLEDKKQVEIVEGLYQGERLITSNYETLRPRTRVRVADTRDRPGGGGGRGQGGGGGGRR